MAGGQGFEPRLTDPESGFAPVPLRGEYTMSDQELTKNRWGTGSIRKRTDGRWEGIYTFGGRAKSVYGQTREEVERKLKTLIAHTAAAGYLPERHKLHEVFDRYLAEGRDRWKPKTYSDYQQYIRVIKNTVPNVSLDRVQPALFRALLDAHANHPRTALYLYQILHCAFERARTWQWTTGNPLNSIDRPRCRAHKKVRWNIEDCRRFLAEGRSGTCWPFLHFLLLTGLRFSEAVALRWSDIDWQRKTLLIDKSLQYLDGQWVQSTPKTENAVRLLRLNEYALSLLDYQRTQQQQRAVHSPVVWTNSLGKPLHAQVALKSFRRLAKRIDLPPQTLHDLRHLSGSLALHAGVPIALVSEFLGHADVSITLKTYTHAMVKGDAVSDALSATLGPTPLRPSP